MDAVVDGGGGSICEALSVGDGRVVVGEVVDPTVVDELAVILVLVAELVAVTEGAAEVVVDWTVRIGWLGLGV